MQQVKLRGTGEVREPDQLFLRGPDHSGDDTYYSAAGQGYSVALSADGNTAIVGGPWDSWPGAAWVFTRNGSLWTQQGSKLVGSGSVVGDDGSLQQRLGMARAIMQGSSVALSADGNTAILGGPDDNAMAGAAWVFTRKDGVWTQLGDKLVGSGAVVTNEPGKVKGAMQGEGVALSADGKTAIVGGPGDNTIGAAWVFSKQFARAEEKVQGGSVQDLEKIPSTSVAPTEPQAIPPDEIPETGAVDSAPLGSKAHGDDVRAAIEIALEKCGVHISPKLLSMMNIIDATRPVESREALAKVRSTFAEMDQQNGKGMGCLFVSLIYGGQTGLDQFEAIARRN